MTKQQQQQEVQLVTSIIKAVKCGVYNPMYYPNGNKTLELKKVKIGKSKINVFVMYFENGNVNTTAEIKKDRMHGKYTEYRDDGTLYKTQFYRNSICHGLSTVYHPNGKIKSTRPYVNEELSGDFKEYNAEGKLFETTQYKNGLKHGKRFVKNETPGEHYIQHYIDGKLHGKTIIYCSCGVPLVVIVYENNLEISRYDTEHNKTPEQ